MNDFILHRLTKKVVHWLFVAVIVLYAITGIGITQYRIVEQVTLGLLSKPLAFQIHDNLLIPFLVLLVIHVYQVVGRRISGKP